MGSPSKCKRTRKGSNGLPLSPLGDVPDPGIEPGSPALVGRFFIIWATREDPGFGDIFLEITPKVQSILEKKNDKLDFIKIKNFCSLKDNVKRLKRQVTYQKKIFEKAISDKGLLSKIHKECLKSNNKNTNNLFKTWAKYLDRTPKIRRWQINTEERYSSLFVIRKLQIKKIWNTTTTYLLKVKVKSLSCVRLFATPWTVAHQAPPSMGFSRQEYWSGLPFPSHY